MIRLAIQVLQTMNCWEMCKCAHAELVPMLIVAYHAISCCLSLLMIISARTSNLEFLPVHYCILSSCLKDLVLRCSLKIVLVFLVDDSSDVLLEIVICSALSSPVHRICSEANVPELG